MYFSLNFMMKLRNLSFITFRNWKYKNHTLKFTQSSRRPGIQPISPKLHLYPWWANNPHKATMPKIQKWKRQNENQAMILEGRKHMLYRRNLSWHSLNMVSLNLFLSGMLYWWSHLCCRLLSSLSFFLQFSVPPGYC